MTYYFFAFDDWRPLLDPSTLNGVTTNNSSRSSLLIPYNFSYLTTAKIPTWCSCRDHHHHNSCPSWPLSCKQPCLQFLLVALEAAMHRRRRATNSPAIAVIHAFQELKISCPSRHMERPKRQCKRRCVGAVMKRLRIESATLIVSVKFCVCAHLRSQQARRFLTTNQR